MKYLGIEYDVHDRYHRLWTVDINVGYTEILNLHKMTFDGYDSYYIDGFATYKKAKRFAKYVIKQMIKEEYALDSEKYNQASKDFEAIKIEK